jgi:anti-anti-sigma factor
MHVQVEKLQSLAIVRPIGRFYGGDETAELEHKLGILLDGTRNVIVDLERTRDLNSSAIGALVAAQRQAAAHAAQIALCHVDRSIENMLTIIKLVNVLPVYADAAAAVAAFSPRPAAVPPTVAA